MRYPSGAGPSVCPPRVGRCVCAVVENAGAELRAVAKRDMTGRERASAVNARGAAIVKSERLWRVWWWRLSEVCRSCGRRCSLCSKVPTNQNAPEVNSRSSSTRARRAPYISRWTATLYILFVIAPYHLYASTLTAKTRSLIGCPYPGDLSMASFRTSTLLLAFVHRL